MRHGTQTLGRNQLARLTANAIGLVLNTHQGRLQSLDKLQLTLSQTG